jgi:subtilase family serine protease
VLLRRPLAVAACLGIVAATVGAGATHAVAAPVEGKAAHVDVARGSLLQLATDVVPNLAKLTPTGPADPDQRMQVIVAIANPNTAAAQTYLHEVSDPTDALYRHFLTPAEYGQRFGVSADQTADVISRLTAGGMRVDDVTAGGDAITATGTVAAVEKTFAVSEDHYLSNGYDFIANTTGPTLWSADDVETVIGLNTLQRYLTPGQTAKLSGVKQPADSGVSGPIPTSTTVFDLRKLYDIPATATGAGQGITIIGEGDPTIPISDLAKFETEYGLPTTTPTVNCVDKNSRGVGDCGTDTSGNGEWDIDFQSSTAMAPKATLTLDFSQSLGDTDLDNAFLYWINDKNGTRQASASEGVCEEGPLNSVVDDPNDPANSNETEGTGEALGDNQEPVLHTAFLQAALEGRTMFASTGDTGNTCGAIIVGPIGAGNGVIYNGVPNTIDYPAADPYVVAVGGTEVYPNELSSDSSACAEDTGTEGNGSTPASFPASTMAYPDCTENGWEYSGGGIASYLDEGDYAASDGVTKVPCLLEPDATTLQPGPDTNCRETPDVSAQSGGLLDGMAIVSGGSDSTGSGTSLAAPMWQGMWTDIQSAADPTTAPNGFGFADETIYKLATNATTYAADFHDVTVGLNPLPAGTGYDNVTGWGTPNVAGIITDANLEGPQVVTAELPEAPLALLLPLAGLAAVGAGYGVRRRRRSA